MIGYNKYIKLLSHAKSSVTTKTFRDHQTSETIQSKKLPTTNYCCYYKKQSVKQISQHFESLK